MKALLCGNHAVAVHAELARVTLAAQRRVAAGDAGVLRASRSGAAFAGRGR